MVLSKTQVTPCLISIAFRLSKMIKCIPKKKITVTVRKAWTSRREISHLSNMKILTLCSWRSTARMRKINGRGFTQATNLIETSTRTMSINLLIWSISRIGQVRETSWNCSRNLTCSLKVIRTAFRDLPLTWNFNKRPSTTQRCKTRTT